MALFLLIVMLINTQIKGMDLSDDDELYYVTVVKCDHPKEIRALQVKNYDLEQRNLALRNNLWYLERIAGFFAYFSIALLIREWLEEEWGKK